MLTPNQWVIVDFTPNDYVSIYAIEGLAYQYWRCTAKMRALAKGSEVSISMSGELVQTESLELYRLMESYDRRIDNPSLLFSNAGLIARVSSKQGHPLHHVLDCSYNTRRLPVKQLPALYGPIDRSYIPNFLVGMLDARAYLDGHSILAKPFEKKFGIPLHHVVALMAATSIFALGRLVALDLPIWRSIFELSKRAYRVLGYSSESLSDALLAYAQEVCKAMSSSPEGLPESVATFLDRYSLTSKNQVVISLWTHGPRAIFIPYGNARILDVSAAARLLVNLFFGVRDTFGKKGFEFEDSARQFLEQNGFQVLRSRILENKRGERRETDIAVRVGDTLVLCDCRTIDRPLDIEIGVPGRLEVRQSFLEEKMKAIESIAAFVNQSTVGSNYDFAWAKSIHSVGVSPFVEWIWSEDDRYWIDRANDVPRVMSISELQEWLSTL